MHDIKIDRTLKKLYDLFVIKIEDTIQYKLNAGKKVGTYNTAKLWDITDESDLIFLKYLCNNPNEVFNEIVNHVSQTVITVTDEDNGEE